MAAYLLSGARTPSGSFLGALGNISAPTLGATAISGALAKTTIEGHLVDEVFMGHVISAGVGQAPARQAAIAGGLQISTPCTTINKVCGSGLQALICGVQSILAGDNKVVVAGGMESMSMAPHLMPVARKGHKFGDSKVKDAILSDGLWDVYSKRPMGNCAEVCAEKFQITREQQDQYAIESFRRAQKALDEGLFADEIVPVVVTNRKGPITVSVDEGPYKANFEKIPKLAPAFLKDGTITAANASTLNDGAAAVVLAGEEYANCAKFKVVSYASHAQDPTWFTTAPIAAIKKVLDKAQLKMTDIDLFEINEAFSVVAMVAINELKIDRNKVNIYGGGISLGHPIGASGARIIVTLMNAMEKNRSRYGLAAICIGGGEALSMIIERI